MSRLSMHRARLVMARDPVSAQYAAQLGRPVDVLSTDVAFALPVPDVPQDRDVLLNVSGLLWAGGPHVDAHAYRQTVETLYRELTGQGRRVSLLAHVLPSHLTDNDVPALEALAASVGTDVEIVVPADLSDVRRVVAGARLVIGSRMHACLNALSVGTPALPLAYSRKFHPLLESLGWPHTVDLRSSPDAAGEILDLVRLLDDAPAGQVDAVRQRARELLLPAEQALRGLT